METCDLALALKEIISLGQQTKELSRHANLGRERKPDLIESE